MAVAFTFKRPIHGLIQTHMHFFIDRKIACSTSFLTMYSILFYDKELTCAEAMDPLVCFNRRV